MKDPQDTVSDDGVSTTPEHNARSVPPQSPSIDFTMAQGANAVNPAAARNRQNVYRSKTKAGAIDRSSTSQPDKADQVGISRQTISPAGNSVAETAPTVNETGATGTAGAAAAQPRDEYDTLFRYLSEAQQQSMQAQTAEDKLTAALEASSLQGERGDATMGATRNSLTEDIENGRAREETRGSFLRRAAGAGYEVYEGETATYGFRRAGQPNDRGISGETTRSAQTKQELISLGIAADVVDGSILRNQNGITSVRDVQQSVTVDRSHVFISKNATLPPRNIAGHEAFHLWKNGVGRDAYIETVEDNLLFTSKAFLEYQSSIAETYLGGEADLANDEQMAKLREELLANISGDIHEGVNDDYLRPMFRDFDAVKAAWNELMLENVGKTRYPLKDSEQLTHEINRLMQDDKERGRSEAPAWDNALGEIPPAEPDLRSLYEKAIVEAATSEDPAPAAALYEALMLVRGLNWEAEDRELALKYWLAIQKASRDGAGTTAPLRTTAPAIDPSRKEPAAKWTDLPLPCHSEKNSHPLGGCFSWESVFFAGKRIAAPVCELARNDRGLN